MLSLAQTIGIVGTMVLTLYFSKRQIQSLKIPYRMVQGVVRGLSEYVKIVEEIHFTHIRRRMIRIKPVISL